MSKTRSSSAEWQDADITDVRWLFDQIGYEDIVFSSEDGLVKSFVINDHIRVIASPLGHLVIQEKAA